MSAGLFKNKDVGKLLYHVATKLKNKKFQSLIVDYIARQKIILDAQLDGMCRIVRLGGSVGCVSDW